MSAVSASPSEPKRKPPWRQLVVTWILAWIAAGVVGAAAAMAVIEFGLFDATASRPHYRLVGWATHAAFIGSVKVRAKDIQAPASFNRAQVVAGFHEYEADCVMCHGGPGVPRRDFVKGMTPTPPFLLDAARRWTPAQLYWITGQGIKMTAMPAWRTTRSQGQVWDTIAFLEALPYLSAADYARMRAADGVAGTAPPDRAPPPAR